nr:oxidoreductase [Planctomycetales bacterium]
VEAGQTAYRSLRMDGDELDFTTGFEDLHTAVYREICGGGGCGIREARPAIELVHAIRHSGISSAPSPADLHPLIAR